MKRTHEDVVGTRLGRDWHRRNGEKPCDPCRIAWNAVTRERVARLRSRPGWAPTQYDHQCKHCGIQFQSKYVDQSYCSRSCVGKSQRRNPSTELVYVGPRPESWSHAPAAVVTIVTTPKWWDVIVAGPCSWCGRDFTATGGSARYCSKTCGRGAAKAARGDRFNPSPTLRRAIYERDDWTCQLCLEPVDCVRSEAYNPWAPSLDHIVPQSHMLVPDHSPENLRTAHVWCNSIRGDDTYYSDFFSVGA